MAVNIFGNQSQLGQYEFHENKPLYY